MTSLSCDNLKGNENIIHPNVLSDAWMCEELLSSDLMGDLAGRVQQHSAPPANSKLGNIFGKDDVHPSGTFLKTCQIRPKGFFCCFVGLWEEVNE